MLHILNTSRSAPGWLLKSRMRWWDCRRSGFDDDRFPLTGRGGGICLDCFIPTMLSSCDWPTQTSLWKQEREHGSADVTVLSTTGRGRYERWQELEAVAVQSMNSILKQIYPHFTHNIEGLVQWRVQVTNLRSARSLEMQTEWVSNSPQELITNSVLAQFKDYNNLSLLLIFYIFLSYYELWAAQVYVISVRFSSASEDLINRIVGFLDIG